MLWSCGLTERSLTFQTSLVSLYFPFVMLVHCTKQDCVVHARVGASVCACVRIFPLHSLNFENIPLLIFSYHNLQQLRKAHTPFTLACLLVTHSLLCFYMFFVFFLNFIVTYGFFSFPCLPIFDGHFSVLVWEGKVMRLWAFCCLA